MRLIRAASAVANAIPFRLMVPLSTGVGRLIPLLRPALATDLEANLARVQPEASQAELRDLAQDSYGSYGRYWAESFRLPSMSAEKIDDGFEVIGYEHLVRARESGLGPIMVIPHLGGWEWAAAWLGRVAEIPVSAVVEQLEHEDVFDWFKTLRESLNVNIIPLGSDTFAHLLRAVKENDVICLLADRDIGGTGTKVNFFGHPASLPVGPALLARRTGSVILPTAVYFRGNKRICQIDPPIVVDPELRLRQALRETTQQVAYALERLIGQAPGQWHVLQPVWTDRSRGAEGGDPGASDSAESNQ